MLVDLKSWLLSRALIEDVPIEKFNEILKDHLDEGWEKIFVYGGFDAWIDYGRANQKKGRVILRFEWGNWTEGKVIGPKPMIDQIALRHGLKVSKRRERFGSGGGVNVSED